MTVKETFDANRHRFEGFLLSCDDDQMLYNFRAACGLPLKNAAPMTGWDSPEGLLRGHTTGHYLSGLALACAAGSENSERLKIKIDYMVDSLEECQNVFESSGNYESGFLSAYSEEQFDKLEEFVFYPKIWAPYYTLHKILAGLLDCYEYGGNEKALRIAAKVGKWVYARLCKLPSRQLNRMWAMYIAGEYGGMNEVLARLYKFKANPEFITAAALFNHIAGNGDPPGPTGGSTYFMPLLPGGKKRFDTQSNSCCHSTGLESHVKYQELIYFKSEDTLYVNLYIASQLDWKEKKITVKQSGDFLKEEKAVIEIGGGGNVELRLRVPFWLRGKAAIAINGAVTDYAIDDGYAVLKGPFKDGDKVEISLPFSF